MYSIRLNSTIIAVSSTLEGAMRASHKLVCNYYRIRNPNCVKFPTGIQFHPSKNSAIAEAIVNTYDNKETVRVSIAEILVV